MNATSSKPNAPWESDDCFPAKPSTHDYGYLEKGQLVGCSLEQLTDRCSGLDLPEIELVWHPKVPRLVPVRAAAFLKDALRNRERATLKHNAKIAGFNVLVFCVFGLSTHNYKEYFVLAVFFAVFTGVLPLIESWRELRNFNEMDWDTADQITPFDRYSAWVETRSTTMTWTLLAIIGAIGMVQGLTGGAQRSVYLAGLVKPLVREGQWWRLFTGPLLHGSFIHFIVNAAALLGLGRLMEALAGHYRLAIVFAVTAIGGSLFSFYFMPNAPSVGASGGLLGLIGFLIVLGWRRRSLLPPGFARIFWINVALVTVMGAIAHGLVDNAAHLGGFVFGLVTGFFMIPKDGSLPLPASRSITAFGMVAIAGVVFFGVIAICRIVL